MSKQRIIKEVITFIIPLLIAYIILSYFIMVSVVQSGSMEPALPVGDTVFYNRTAYWFSEPQRGDIVVFYSDEFGEYWGKRIAGIPGDEVKFREGKYIVNGMVVEEEYISDEIKSDCKEDFVVPDGCYFMLGDNREISNDSRFWKNPYIKKGKIVGKYMGKIPFSFQFDVWYPIKSLFD